MSKPTLEDQKMMFGLAVCHIAATLEIEPKVFCVFLLDMYHCAVETLAENTGTGRVLQ
jgi:hypothetical protein